MRKQSIYDRILTSPTGAINRIEGDKQEVMGAILTLEKQGFIKVIYDEQTSPISFTKTKEGLLLNYNGGYRKMTIKKKRKNIFKIILSLFEKLIGFIIGIATCI